MTTLSALIGGGGGAAGGYDAVATQMIVDQISAASVEAAWQMADRREVFDALVFNLTGVELANTTAAAAFDNAADALAFASNETLRDYFNASSFLGSQSSASTELGAYYKRTTSDISTANYDSVSFDIDGLYITGIAFNPDGTKMYAIQENNNRVEQYTLATPWDLSSASYDNVSLSVAGQIPEPSDLAFSHDGVFLFISRGDTTEEIYKYTLSNPWDISTATYTSTSTTLGQANAIQGFSFNGDGTKLFLVCLSSDEVNQYTLSTPYDLGSSSLTWEGQISVISPGTDTESIGRAIQFNFDGTKMFILGDQNNKLYQWDLATPWDALSATYSGKSYSISEGTDLHGLYFSDDGERFFVANQNKTVFQYSGATTAPTNILAAP